MSLSTVINDKITLNPSELNDIYSNILSKVNDKNKICTKDRGYVIDIKIISYKENIVSRTTGNCIFNVIYNISYLKPEVGDVYSAIVTYVFDKGVILKYKQIDIIVPTIAMDTYVYRTQTDDFFNANTAHIINIGCWLRVQIQAVEYENHMYKCVASLFKEV